MTEQPKQRFRGLVHLPRSNEDEPARMAIERSSLPDMGGQGQWKSVERSGHRSGTISGNRERYKSNPLGHLYSKLLESPVDVNVEGKGDSLSFSVDDFTKHFGKHPEDLMRRAVRTHSERTRAQKARSQEPTTATEDFEMPNEASPAQEKPVKSAAPAALSAPVAPAKPKMNLNSYSKCNHCGAFSSTPITDESGKATPEGLIFVAKHMTGECKYG